MDERFLKWLSNYDEFKEGTELRDILYDAICCYRHGIARPALMLSYIAFVQAVRNNLLKSEMPSGYKPEKWNAHMNNLRRENKWDAEVIDCIKQKANGTDNPALFELSDTLRDDVCYWRNRRNECAHYKDSEISLSHVSAFWIFMMDHYTQFSPLGSIGQSINEYKRHYDVSLNPQGLSTERIFQRLCLAIKTREDLVLFLKDTYSAMGKANQFLLLHKLLGERKHRQKVVEVLTKNMDMLRAYLIYFHSDVSSLLGNKPEIVRKLWYDDFQNSGRCVNVYIETLRAKLIPEAEIKESLSMLLEQEYEHARFHISEAQDFAVLIENGLYDLFIDEYLTKDAICNNPREKCYKTDFYIGIIRRGGITDKLIKTLANSVKGCFPYTLHNRLKDEIFNVEENKNKYIETIDRLKIDDYLKLKTEKGV